MPVVKVRLALSGTILPPEDGLIHGDGLLHAAQTRKLFPSAWLDRKPLEWEEIPLPVRKVGSVWAVSALRFPCRTDLSINGIAKRRDELVIGWTDQGSSPFRLAMIREQAFSAPYALFYIEAGESQLLALPDLLNRLVGLGIGRRTAKGHGFITDVQASRTDEVRNALWDYERHGPRRSIPKEEVPEAPDPQEAFLRSIAVTPPYWHSPKVEAYTPVWGALYGRPYRRPVKKEFKEGEGTPDGKDEAQEQEDVS